ncbi:MAG TPA: PEGA domain-containing protein [Gammaproteobacteria bacterium]|nr:PEGA domain-containing protein [Gammaproteobacteria bacterium]
MHNENIRIEAAPFKPHTPGRRSRSLKLRAGVALTGLFLLASLGTAWFLFSARAVYVNVAPAEARIDVATPLQLRLADRFLLLSGNYSTEITAEGYQPLTVELPITEQQNQEFHYQLQPLPGSLKVTTPGVTGVAILLDGVARGVAPAVIAEIPQGGHRLTLQAERYFPIETDIEIEGLGREQELTVELKPAWADVEIASEPGDAEVFLGEESLGRTPLATTILEGRHRLMVKRDGFKPWIDHIQITAGQAQSLTGIYLAPADATVLLSSDPPQANTTVNGEYMGMTPLELALTPGQTATIKLHKPGFLSAERSLQPASGDQVRLNVPLQPELVEVSFDIRPADADLYIDGVPAGTGSQRLRLAVRGHRIEVKKAGYADYSDRVTLLGGVDQQVSIELKTIAEVRKAQIKTLIATKAGHTLKLLEPYAFTLGASRREAGRRANETLRTVELRKPFYLSLHEVTNAQFREMQQDHRSGDIQGISLDDDPQPVTSITWEQAARYCNWLSRKESLPLFYKETGGRITGVNPAAAGYRLPSEAEWEWAARAIPGTEGLKFPWGQALPPAARSGNYADETAAAVIGRILENYDDGHLATAPPGSFPAGNSGLFDMGGNVSEWVHDYYGIGMETTGAAADPLGPESGEFHVIKGSSWAHGTITELRLSYRDYGDQPRNDVGFRIARYLE